MQELSRTPFSIVRGRPSRRRKGRRLISRSAHWIETQERTGGLHAIVSQDDLQMAAMIKSQRVARGNRRVPMTDEEEEEPADSESSWGMKIASPTSSTGANNADQVCSSTNSDSPLSRAHRIRSSIGVVFGITVAGKQTIGEVGVL